MKKPIFRMFAASLVFVALAGCVRDKAPAGQTSEGTPVNVALKLKFSPNQGTRATTTGDANAIPAEVELKTLDVFIYTDAGDFLDRVHLEPNDFVQQPSVTGADVWQTTAQINTTTGVKNFYVGANLPAAAVAALEHRPLSVVPTMTQTIARTDIDLAKGLPMFSTALITKTLDPTPRNEITAEIKRLVAKVTVEHGTDIDVEGTTGTLGQLEWAINNQNRKYFLMQGASPNFADPNWSTYTATDFAPATASDYVSVNLRQGTPIATADYNALYALENTSYQKSTKELTRVTVRATFIPAEWVTDYTPLSGTVTREPNPNNLSQTVTEFHTVSPAVGRHEFFRDLDDATTFATEKGVGVETFTGGLCYWNIFLNKEFHGDVYRNDFYQCRITRIVAPGAPTNELTNPDNQPTTDTSITVAVNPLNWNTPVMDDYELIP